MAVFLSGIALKREEESGLGGGDFACGALILGGGEGRVGSGELACLAVDLQDLTSRLCGLGSSSLRSHSEGNVGAWGFR